MRFDLDGPRQSAARSVPFPRPFTSAAACTFGFRAAPYAS